MSNVKTLKLPKYKLEAMMKITKIFEGVINPLVGNRFSPLQFVNAPVKYTNGVLQIDLQTNSYSILIQTSAPRLWKVDGKRVEHDLRRLTEKELKQIRHCVYEITKNTFDINSRKLVFLDFSVPYKSLRLLSDKDEKLHYRG